MDGRTLIIGELISNGGVGLQGDIIIITALGGRPLTIATQISTLYTPLKRTVYPIDAGFISQQLNSCLDYPGVDAIKIGNIGSVEAIEKIDECLKKRKIKASILLNPTLVTASGETLMDPQELQALKRHILPHVTLLVLNVTEAEHFSGLEIETLEDLNHAAHMLTTLGCESILITGGLLEGERVYDILITPNEDNILSSPKEKPHQLQEQRFGGGWALTTAITTSLAQGMSLLNAVNRGRQFINLAIRTAEETGQYYQSLNLTHTIRPFSYDENYQPYTVIPGKKS